MIHEPASKKHVPRARGSRVKLRQGQVAPPLAPTFFAKSLLDVRVISGTDVHGRRQQLKLCVGENHEPVPESQRMTVGCVNTLARSGNRVKVRQRGKPELSQCCTWRGSGRAAIKLVPVRDKNEPPRLIFVRAKASLVFRCISSPAALSIEA